MKNAHIYRAQLPAIDSLAEALAQLPAREPEPAAAVTRGFCPPPVTGELVTPLGGGAVAFCLLTHSKVMPAKAVKLAASKRAAAAELAKGEPLTRKERLSLVKEVVVEMLPAAFVEQQITTLYYSPANELLIVDAASSQRASTALSMLLRAVGSLKTTTIHIDGIKNSLAALLRDSLTEQRDSIGPFRAGGELQLSGLDGEIVRYKGIDPVCHDELLSHLTHGYKVEKIALANDAIRFNLHADFRISGISIESNDDEDLDAAAAWRAQAGAGLVLLCDVVNALCALLHREQEREQAAA